MGLIAYIRTLITGSDQPNVESTSRADYEEFMGNFPYIEEKQKTSVHDVGIFSDKDKTVQSRIIELDDGNDQSDENDTYDKIEIG